MPKFARQIERSLYQAPIGRWRPASGSHPLLCRAFHLAQLREHCEMNWRQPDFSVEDVSEAPAEFRQRYDSVIRTMRSVPEDSTGVELFQAAFGRDPHDKETTEVVVTPFGLIFILARRDYEDVTGNSWGIGAYLFSAYLQERISERYRERVTVISTHYPDISPLEPTRTLAMARHDYEHMFRALHEVGQFRKKFFDETTTLLNNYLVTNIARLWEDNNTPTKNIPSIIGKALQIVEWWRDAFAEAYIKDEIIGEVADHLCNMPLKRALFGGDIDRFLKKLYDEAESFVAIHTKEAFGEVNENYFACMDQFNATWQGLNLQSYLIRQRWFGLVSVSRLLIADVPARVALELASMIPLKDWEETMPSVIG